MPTTSIHRIESTITVAAPADVVLGLLTDTAGWPQYSGSAVHAEPLGADASGQLVRHWSVVDSRTTRSWRVRRSADPATGRIVFVHEPAAAPAREVRGEFVVKSVSAGSCAVEMRHEIDVDPVAAGADELLAAVSANSENHLETLRDVAERRDELADLVLSFEDPLFIGGAVEDAYEYLYRADLWPERIPHVSRLEMTEDTPGIQFFDMDTTTPDGSAHTTRSVRVCLPHHKIVYKQIRLPALLDAHTGHWLFTPTPEGLIASARHTVTIKPSALGVLGAGTTVAGARRYLRRVLGANSMGNLTLAKKYAEERAGV